jgi:SARP family transcriptional regulator, regulator of embCAB operon
VPVSDTGVLRYEVLGPLRAWRGDTPLALGPAKQRAVLAVLLLAGNRPVSSAAIVDAVWGDAPPDNGANVVQKYVGALRRVLEPDRAPRSPAGLLPLTEAGYQLSVEPGCLDADEFAAEVRAAQSLRAADPGAAAATLRSALGRWHGEVLAGLTGPVFDGARVRLADARAGAWELYAELELALGRQSDLAAELLRLVEEFPGRERLRALLMLALHRSGRQADALAAYRDAHRYLADELGIAPGDQLQRLHQRMLTADPSLQGEPVPLPEAAAPPARHTAPAAPAAGQAAPAVPPAAPAAGQAASAVPPAAPAAGRAAPPAGALRPGVSQTAVAHAIAAAQAAAAARTAAAQAAATHGVPEPPPPAVPSYAVPPYAAPPMVYGVPAHSYAPPDPWAAPRYGTPESVGPTQPPQWMRRAPALLVPLATFGFLTFVVIGYLASRRRSWWNVAAAAGYLALTVLVLSLPAGDGTRRTDGLIAIALLINMFAGAAHGWLLSGRPQSDRVTSGAGLDRR